MRYPSAYKIISYKTQADDAFEIGGLDQLNEIHALIEKAQRLKIPLPKFLSGMRRLSYTKYPQLEKFTNLARHDLIIYHRIAMYRDYDCHYKDLCMLADFYNVDLELLVKLVKNDNKTILMPKPSKLPRSLVRKDSNNGRPNIQIKT